MKKYYSFFISILALVAATFLYIKFTISINVLDEELQNFIFTLLLFQISMLGVIILITSLIKKIKLAWDEITQNTEEGLNCINNIKKNVNNIKKESLQNAE
jgi:hypothetical protein